MNMNMSLRNRNNQQSTTRFNSWSCVDNKSWFVGRATTFETTATAAAIMLESESSNFEQFFLLKRISFIKILLKIQYSNLVRPANLTGEWHKSVSFLYCFLLLSGIVIGYIIFGSCYMTVIAHECINRSRHRINQLSCQRWHPGGALILDHLYRIPKLESQFDQQAYYDFISNDNDYQRGNSSSFWVFSFKLALIEFKNLLPTVNSSIHACETLVIYALSIVWIWWYSCMYIFAMVDKFIRLHQISAQLKYCTRKSYDLLNRSRVCSNINQAEDEQLAEALMITYLNFELFRRQQREFSRLTNFLLGQIGALTGVTIVLSYIVGVASSSASRNLLLLYMCSIMAFFMDAYLISGAMFTSKIRHIMKGIAKLVASCTLVSENSTRGFYIHYLWRRQMMSETQTMRFFAPNLFGIRLSFEKVITLNGYFVGLWLVLLGTSTSRAI